MSNNVIPLRTLTPKRALKRMRELSAESDNVFFSPQAEEWKVEGAITYRQILDALRNGEAEAMPYLNADGLWEATFSHHHSGESIRVTAVIYKDADSRSEFILIVRL